MIQKIFADRVTEIVRNDKSVTGLAVAGSWITNEVDEFSDLDLVLVTKQKLGGDKARMIDYARNFGELLSAFTGEHVGEPRLLICLYDNPLLHVDIKFVTLEEFGSRVETPVILYDEDGQLHQVINHTKASFPYPDFQWIEDRFWTWVHYASLKIGRGEYFEAHDFFGYLRMVVLGPLLHIKNGNLPKGVRKVETQLAPDDLDLLQRTLANHDAQSLFDALQHSITLYRKLRQELFSPEVVLNELTENRVMEYIQDLKYLLNQSKTGERLKQESA